MNPFRGKKKITQPLFFIYDEIQSSNFVPVVFTPGICSKIKKLLQIPDHFHFVSQLVMP